MAIGPCPAHIALAQRLLTARARLYPDQLARAQAMAQQAHRGPLRADQVQWLEDGCSALGLAPSSPPGAPPSFGPLPLRPPVSQAPRA